VDDEGLAHALSLDGFASSHFLLHLLDRGRHWLGVLALVSQNIKTKNFIESKYWNGNFKLLIFLLKDSVNYQIIHHQKVFSGYF